MTSTGNNRIVRGGKLSLAERALIVLLMALLVDVSVYEPIRPVLAAAGVSVQDLTDDFGCLSTVQQSDFDLGPLVRQSANGSAAKLTSFTPCVTDVAAAADAEFAPILCTSPLAFAEFVVVPTDRSHPCAVRAP